MCLYKAASGAYGPFRDTARSSQSQALRPALTVRKVTSIAMLAVLVLAEESVSDLRQHLHKLL